MTPEQYCEQKTVTSYSSFYYSFLFLEPDQRRAITALYAFCREVDDVVDECHEPQLARIKLQWWRDEIARAFQGTPQHPVSRALQPWLQQYNLPQEYFLEIIDGMEMDLDYDCYPTFKDLMLYCYRVAGVVGLLSAEIFGHQDRRTLKYAQDLGTALQLTNILRDIREDGERGRLYLPLEDLERYGLGPQDIFRHSNSEQMRALLDFQIERAKQYYRQAYSHLPDIDRYAQRSGIIMAAVYEALLDEIGKDSLAVMHGRVSLSPWRKLWIAWRTARREKQRHLKM